MNKGTNKTNEMLTFSLLLTRIRRLSSNLTSAPIQNGINTKVFCKTSPNDIAFIYFGPEKGGHASSTISLVFILIFYCISKWCKFEDKRISEFNSWTMIRFNFYSCHVYCSSLRHTPSWKLCLYLCVVEVLMADGKVLLC